MKVENEKALKYVEVLGKCGSVTGLPGMIIAITRRKISSELSEYVDEKRRLFEKYGEKQGNGWKIKADSPEFEKAMNEISEIASFEIDIDIPRFTEDEFLEKFRSDQLSAENYEFLYDIFVKKEAKDGEQN